MSHAVRIIEIQDLKKAREELQSLGAHPKGIEIMSSKGVFRAVKLKSVPSTAANIIKQEMLSKGGEAAAAYGVINHSVEKTDLLLMGTVGQIYKLIGKLNGQGFGLRELAQEIKKALENFEKAPEPIRVGSLNLEFGKRTYLMGILNVTPDSFSDGGKFFEREPALAQAKKMMEEGADIIDVGGESTRPGAQPLSVQEEIERVVPVIERIVKESDIAVSIDTRKAGVAEAALKAGAKMVNDISGLRHDPQMAKIAAQAGVPLVIMHIQGHPENMQQNPRYEDLTAEIMEYLRESIELAVEAGVAKEKIIIDPGIGFGKTLEHNLEILKRLSEFRALGRPLLVGTSRKSMIGKVLDLPVSERLEGTAATVALSIARGADIVRVHDVREMLRVARMADAIIRKDGHHEKEKN